MILHKPVLLLFSVFFTAHSCSYDDREDNPSWLASRTNLRFPADPFRYQPPQPRDDSETTADGDLHDLAWAGSHLETKPLREPLNWDWPEADSKSDSNTPQEVDHTTTALKWDWPEMTEESQSKKQPKNEDVPKESLTHQEIIFSEKKNWRLSLENVRSKAENPLEQKFLRRLVPQVMCAQPWNILSPSANRLRCRDGEWTSMFILKNFREELNPEVRNNRCSKLDDSIEVEIRGDISCNIRISPKTKVGELKIFNKGDTVYGGDKKTLTLSQRTGYARFVGKQLKEDDFVQKQLIIFKKEDVPDIKTESEVFADTITATPMVDERLRVKPFQLKPFKFSLNCGEYSRTDIWNEVGKHYEMILEKILSDDEAVFVKKTKKEGLYIRDFENRDLEQRIWVRVDVQKANCDDISINLRKKMN